MTREHINQRSDIYSRITDKIIAELDRGVRPWTQQWQSALPSQTVTRPLRHNGEPYSGINVLLLWSEAIARGFSSRFSTASSTRLATLPSSATK